MAGLFLLLPIPLFACIECNQFIPARSAQANPLLLLAFPDPFLEVTSWLAQHT